MKVPIQISDILLNAQDLHLEHPHTFYVPDMAELSTIVPGDNVKIGIILDSEKCGASAERFWVLVTAVTDTSITGTVNNDLVFSCAHNIKNEDLVQFDFSAVMDILSAGKGI